MPSVPPACFPALSHCLQRSLKWSGLLRSGGNPGSTPTPQKCTFHAFEFFPVLFAGPLKRPPHQPPSSIIVLLGKWVLDITLLPASISFRTSSSCSSSSSCQKTPLLLSSIYFYTCSQRAHRKKESRKRPLDQPKASHTNLKYEEWICLQSILYYTDILNNLLSTQHCYLTFERFSLADRKR